MKILPAINAKTKKELLTKIKAVKGLVDTIHIDIMDGEFVPATTIQAKEVNSLKDVPNIQIHLMTQKPLAQFKKFKNKKIKEFIVHAESDKDILSVLREIKKKKIKAGIALNPKTSPDKGLKQADIALIMTINPGFSGQKFIAYPLKKIKSIKKLNKNILIGIDGGMNRKNIYKAKKTKLDFVCVASALYNSKNIKRALTELKK